MRDIELRSILSFVLSIVLTYGPISPKDFKDLYKVNRDFFILSSSLLVIDGHIEQRINRIKLKIIELLEVVIVGVDV